MTARGDLEVLHEPLCDLAAGTRHQLASGRSLGSVDELLDHVEALRAVRPVFVKETCEHDYRHHLAETGLLRDAIHAFMLRDPAKVINSHFNVNPHVKPEEIGFRHLAKLLDLVRTKNTHAPIFVEAEKLESAPETEVQRFCARAGITHLPQSLSWSPGHLDLWQRTKRWHEEVAASSSIQPRESRYEIRVDNEPRLGRLHAENLPFYSYLKQACDEQPEPTFTQP
jgi:adenylylsulfate kinase